MESFKDFCTKNNIKMDTLTNFDLINYAKQLHIKNFRGVFMQDELPKRIKTNECAIVNLQKSDQDGSHWTCYYKHGKEKYYFDSYGLEPTNEMLKYLKSPLIILHMKFRNLELLCVVNYAYMFYMS